MRVSFRSQKLAGILAESIPALIHKFFTPDQVGFLTVMAVEVSGDLGVADIFIRSFGEHKHVCRRLNAGAGKFSHELMQLLPTLRRPIRLRFKPDKSGDLQASLSHLE